MFTHSLLPPLTVTALQCERRVAPLGVDTSEPRLGWVLSGEGRERKQTCYQVVVGTSRVLHDLWDSGRVVSDDNVDIHYKGKPLSCSQQVYWRVRVWDESGSVSGWSPISTWTAGILSAPDWKAKWISGAGPGAKSDSTLLRKEFPVHSGLKRAIVYMTGLGQYEMHVNGRRIGDNLLSPGWTNYRKTVLYDTFDVTRDVRKGANVVGILLGNGMDNVHGPRYRKFTGAFGPQRAFGQIHLIYSDGTTQVVPTDRSWAVHEGPISYSSVYGGEDYDFRREPKGWSEPHFLAPWDTAQEVDGPGGSLRGTTSSAPPIRMFETLKPIRTYKIRDGVETVDLGQNASLMVRLALSGPSGSRVRVIPGELIKPDGRVDRTSSGGGDAWWEVTLNGEPIDYFPKFFYHGCRYLQIERFDDSKVLDLKGVVVHSSAAEVGEFSCSSELFNRIHTLVRWAQKSNLMSVLTDCPHRERLGWLEQDHLNGPSLRYEHDLSTFFPKVMQDIADSQLPNGLVPDIAPEYAVFGGPFRDSPEWGSAVIIVPWQQYLFHRDVDLLRARYGAMKRYLAYLRSTATAGVVSHGLGDWYDLGPGEPGPSKNTPLSLTATAFYFEDARILSQIAALLGEQNDALAFATESRSIREAFNHRFFDSEKGTYATGSQTANALALVMNLVEPVNRSGVLDHLVSDIESRENAVTAGDVGYRYVLRALADGGRSDLVFKMNNQSERPGYAYQIKMGATSLTEAWDANPTSSQNHFMLGQIVEWLYHDICGIQPSDGFKFFTIKPSPVEGLTWAKASYRSEYGTIQSSWRRVGGTLLYEISVPVNTGAEVRIPGRKREIVGSGSHQYSVSVAKHP